MHTKTFAAALLVCSALAATNASAQAGPDCGPSAPGQNVLAVFNAMAGAYCVSDFGSSNTYYTAGASGSAPYPSIYNPAADLFSGDDAVNLQFKIAGMSPTGSGWLTPYMDAGSLAAGSYATGSFWDVIAPVHYTTPGLTNNTSSTIRLSLGAVGNVSVTIRTSIDSGGSVTQMYSISNNSTATLTDLTFADYFNFHPNGSDPAATLLGVTRYENGRIYTAGDESDPSFISHGNMRLIDASGQMLMPTAHDVGCADVLGFAPECGGGNGTILNVESGAYNNLDGPLAAGDNGGALAYMAGTLAPGQTVQLGVVKEVPEPPQLWLLLAGLLVFGIGRMARGRDER